MLLFKKVKYKNFLSTGNAWNEYVLDGASTTLIIGTNGAGKTTVLDALCFGLYGKAFRNINKPTLVNSINEKNLVVEVEFATQNNNYLVRRGIKPNVFEIICNGVPVPEFPSSGEMQDYLEKYVLKCNYKAFTQVVILGASSYISFMRLTPAARREVLEDVLDIEVFSVMQTLAKEKLQEKKDECQQAQSAYAQAKSKHDLVMQYTDNWNRRQEETRQPLQQQLVTYETRLIELQARLQELNDSSDAWLKHALSVKPLEEKHTKAVGLVSKFNTELQQLQHTHAFFSKHDSCPMCTQTIESTLKQGKLEQTQQDVVEATTKLNEAKNLVDLTQTKLTKARDARTTWNQIQTEKNYTEDSIATTETSIEYVQEQIQKTYEPPPAMPTNSQDDMVRASQALNDANYEKIVCEQCIGLLKDSGIRTKIIQQYLPVINGWVNYYLHAMNFSVQFTLDEQFNESIKSRYRDEFSYENFSDGEKRRIDLALVLTWRAIARLKNSVYTNLLIFDEIFDSSLDSAGVDDFMRLLETMDADTNVFVISHKVDQLTDKFNTVMMVSKDRGFSTIKKI